MATTLWDPAQYLRFGSERLRPALDLLARIPLGQPAHVVDLGCGAGNVTAILKERWPKADILGVDGSDAMLARAGETAPGCRFAAADIAGFVPDRQPDVIFSNAALHWLADHRRLFPRLISLLAPGGVLAVQMPAMDQAPFRILQQEVAHSGSWAGALSGIGRVRPILDRTDYWDLLRPLAHSVDLWETTYLHVLTGPDAVLQWATGTSLRPYLAALEEPARSAFREAYRSALRPHYPEREDGTTFLSFRRLFLLAAVTPGKRAPPPSEAWPAGTAAPISL
ncbi:MAG: methyltransferase domain-containing protein [Acetobacteraceae bacterium]